MFFFNFFCMKISYTNLLDANEPKLFECFIYSPNCKCSSHLAVPVITVVQEAGAAAVGGIHEPLSRTSTAYFFSQKKYEMHLFTAH